MKYSDANPPLVCMQTQSTCYKGTKKMVPLGILWHSTGANNPWVKRYVQPSDNDPDKAKLLKIIGVNKSGNDWNHIQRQAGLNGWLGKLDDGSIAFVQSMPWNYQPWGCGGGKYGSCNTTHIQFEICEDGLSDPVYFKAIYEEGCQVTAYLCKKFNLNPKGKVMINGHSVDVITCHNDSYKAGLGGGHIDINHWFPKYGKDMSTVREDVIKILEEDKKEMEYSEFKVHMDRYLAERGEMPAAEWAESFIEEAKMAGLTDGTRPEALITRQEVITMVNNVDKKIRNK